VEKGNMNNTRDDHLTGGLRLITGRPDLPLLEFGREILG